MAKENSYYPTNSPELYHGEMVLFAHNVFPVLCFLLHFWEHFHNKIMTFDHSATFLH